MKETVVVGKRAPVGCERKPLSGVKNPCPAMARFHSEYLNWVQGNCEKEDAPFVFPPLKEAYCDGDSSIDRVRCPDFLQRTC